MLGAMVFLLILLLLVAGCASSDQLTGSAAIEVDESSAAGAPDAALPGNGQPGGIFKNTSRLYPTGTKQEEATAEQER